MKTVLSILTIALWGPLLSLALAGCDSQAIYEAKVEKYAVMYCAGGWAVNPKLPQPDCESRRGVDKHKLEY